MSETWKMTNPKDVIGSDKVPLDLFPAVAMAEGSMALLEGALKYGRANFREAGVRSSIYVAAAMRHLMDWYNGEDKAEDSGVSHLGHVLACMAILVDAKASGKLNDDRMPRQDVSTYFKELEMQVKVMKEKYADRNPHHYTLADSPPLPPKPPVFTGILDGFEFRCPRCGDDAVVVKEEQRTGYCINCGNVWYLP